MRLDPYNPSTGRQDYVTSAGRTIQRKLMYFSVAEWHMFYRLAQDSGLSLGKMFANLARQEQQRRSEDYRARLDSLSS